jgi:hypothetical protein
MANFNPDNYIDVQERITRFWTEHTNGAIRTNLMSPPDDFTQCRYRADVFKDRESAEPDATGWAFEIAAPGTRGPNATSHEENCETSAIGRALANMGYATTREDRPSKQEMTKVARSTDAALSRRETPPRDETTEKVSSAISTPAARPGPNTAATGASGDGAGGTVEMRALHAAAKERGLTHDELHAIAAARGKASLKDLTPSELSAFTVWLRRASPVDLRSWLTKAGVLVAVEAAGVAGESGADKWTH